MNILVPVIVAAVVFVVAMRVYPGAIARIFMENDTFSQVDIGSTSKSDPLILVNDAELGRSVSANNNGNNGQQSASVAPSNGSVTALTPAMPL